MSIGLLLQRVHFLSAGAITKLDTKDGVAYSVDVLYVSNPNLVGASHGGVKNSRSPLWPTYRVECTASFIYWARQQTAVARGLAWPIRCFTGRQTAAVREHSLCFLVQFQSNCHAHRRTFATRRR